MKRAWILAAVFVLSTAGAAWAVDNDGDTYDSSIDCNDNNPSIYPGAPEVVANGIDEDCNGGDRCYSDVDDDNFGSMSTVSSTDLDCVDAGEASSPGDCNDNNVFIHPGASEVVANGIDEDCNGGDRCYNDGDGDGFGTMGTTNSADLDCLDVGESANASDCNDMSSSVYPGAMEITANNIDENCNGSENCYIDSDNDDYGIAMIFSSMDADCFDGNEATNSTDCNDGDPAINPGAAEIPADNVDQDCNGGELCYYDGDNDDFGIGMLSGSMDPDCLDTFEAVNATDCNDMSSAVNPAAMETCNMVDDDCDMVVDDGAGTSFYQDQDGDGFGNPLVTVNACSAPGGYVANNTDCLDTNPQCTTDCTVCLLDHYKCYKAKTMAGEPRFTPLDVTLADSFESKNTTVKKPFLFCVPVDKNGEGIVNAQSHLACYKIKDVADPPQAPFGGADVQITNQFGTEKWTISKSRLLCVPSSMTVLP